VSDLSAPLRVAQFLLRDDDVATEDPQRMVATAAAWGANAILLNAAGISAQYPTRLAYQPRNAHLRGDLVGDAVSAARRRGLRFIARVDVSKVDPDIGRAHPDWLRRDAAGNVVTEWAMPETCFTGDHWQRNAFEMVDEMLAAYDVDGVFFNMYRIAHCACDRCHGVLRAEGSAGVPSRADPSDPAWRAYERWRRRALVAYTGRLRDAVHARRDAALLVYHHQKEGWDVPGIARSTDLVSVTASLPVVRNPVSPQPSWPGWPGYEAALGRGLRPDRPAVVFTTTSSLFASRRAAQPPARVRAALDQVAAQRGSPCAAIPGGLAQEDGRALSAVAASFERLAREAAELDGLRSAARVALLASPDTLDLCPIPGEGELSRREEWGCYLALTRAGHPFDVVPLDHAGPDLSRYAAVILPDVSCLAGADAEAIDAWVAAGGTLIATGRAGDFDENGDARDRSALGSLGRPAVAEVRDIAGGYLAVDDADLRAVLGGATVVGVHRELLVVRRDTTAARNDLHLLGPVVDNTPEHAVVPRERGPAALVGGPWGSGWAWHLPWRPGVMYGTDGLLDPATVLAFLVERAAGPALVRIDAPDWVEARYWLQPSRRRAVLFLLNASTTREGHASSAAPLGPVEVLVRAPGRRVYLLPAEDIAFAHTDEGVTFTVPGLPATATIAIDLI
jgi:hypothetical protein